MLCLLKVTFLLGFLVTFISFIYVNLVLLAKINKLKKLTKETDNKEKLHVASEMSNVSNSFRNWLCNSFLRAIILDTMRFFFEVKDKYDMTVAKQVAK